MMLTTSSIPPLETIYEESSSFGGSSYKSVDENLSIRSIPSIDIQSQRVHDNHSKPPIEVRFRDGSKRYIPPLNSTSMIKNRRTIQNSSFDTLSSKTTSTRRSIQTKAPLVVTIITAEDLRQAGIQSSSSDTSVLSSRSTTPSETIHQKPLHLQNSTTLISMPSSEQLFSITSPHLSTSSFQVTLTNDENEKPSSFNSILTNKIPNQTIQPNTTILIQGKARSAFRPFLKSVRFNQDAVSTKSKISTTNNQKLPNTTNTQIIYQPPPKRTNVITSKQTNALVPINSSKHHQQQTINSITVQRLTNSGQPSTFAIEPNMQWHNIQSNSIYNIPQLSTKYSNTPLRITLPIVNSTHNRKHLVKHNPTLEQRLLNAGLSPETIALYERILDVAEKHQIARKLSQQKMINQYPFKSFI